MIKGITQKMQFHGIISDNKNMMPNGQMPGEKSIIATYSKKEKDKKNTMTIINKKYCHKGD